MSHKKTPETFEELLIPRKELPKLASHYRVYKAPGDYIRVEADSALEALKKCGLQQVHRIERDAIYLTNVLNIEALSNQPAPAARAVAETAAAAPAAEPPAPEQQSAPATDAPLSTSDVDTLLKGENATGA